MKEDYLHFLWKFTQFKHQNLKSTDGEPIVLYKTGFLNTDSGPDFKEARMRIGALEWAGNVEIHLRSSDWNRHGHEKDQAYNSVILHVVWQHDLEVYNEQGKLVPTLQLSDFADKKHLNRYRQLLASMGKIACENYFSSVSEIKKLTMLDRALMQRLQRKAEEVSVRLNKNLGDWEETAYQTVAMHFGFKLNNAAFLRLAEAVPFKLVKKYSLQVESLEALLFGMAGFLRQSSDSYAWQLKREYDFLEKKHELKAKGMSVSEWQFLRTRPGNFPTLRLAELIGFLHNRPSLFDLLIETKDFKTLNRLIRQPTSAYWQQHYAFGKASATALQGIGRNSAESLIINALVPIWVAYGKYIDSPQFVDRAIAVLESIPAEKNKITRFWASQDLRIENMSDSQGSIELFNEFCRPKKCLDCSIGHAILKT
ncbi:DUF2851 family protein [Marinilongibacter aquaticus]|uniref:DUF2851 family protein n=1 Tax=Marinilongibacter aquaticus TaxID=2975157 RepID=UPI0021BD51F6|nr:DUF2851 family protein [Marinilongibacter aquaticus]UBM60313.1 DUF2851 family protein [Marinilongibacter aquaticus]